MKAERLEELRGNARRAQYAGERQVQVTQRLDGRMTWEQAYAQDVPELLEEIERLRSEA